MERGVDGQVEMAIWVDVEVEAANLDGDVEEVGRGNHDDGVWVVATHHDVEGEVNRLDALVVDLSHQTQILSRVSEPLASCVSSALASRHPTRHRRVHLVWAHLKYSSLLLIFSFSSNSFRLASASLSLWIAASTLARSRSSRSANLAAFSSSVSRSNAAPSRWFADTPKAIPRRDISSCFAAAME